jgi:hypothetical protein
VTALIVALNYLSVLVLTSLVILAYTTIAHTPAFLLFKLLGSTAPIRLDVPARVMIIRRIVDVGGRNFKPREDCSSGLGVFLFRLYRGPIPSMITLQQHNKKALELVIGINRQTLVRQVIAGNHSSIMLDRK